MNVEYICTVCSHVWRRVTWAIGTNSENRSCPKCGGVGDYTGHFVSAVQGGIR